MIFIPINCTHCGQVVSKNSRLNTFNWCGLARLHSENWCSVAGPHSNKVNFSAVPLFERTCRPCMLMSLVIHIGIIVVVVLEYVATHSAVYCQIRFFCLSFFFASFPVHLRVQKNPISIVQINACKPTKS